MPTGVILTSASQGATEEKVADALASAGLEVEEKEVPAADLEPQRDAFQSDEEYNAAVEEFNATHEAPGKTTDENDDKNDDKDDDKDDEQSTVEQPKRSKFVRRIEKITGKMRTEIDQLRAENERLKAGGKKEEETPPAEQNPRPVRTAYKTQEEYEDALLAWGTERAIETRTAREIEAYQKAEAQAHYDAYKAGVEEFAVEHDDWDEVMSQDVPIHPDVLYSIYELEEKGAAVAYHIGKHPELAQRLAKMPVRSAVMEVGRLASRLEAESGSGVESTAGNRDNRQPRRRLPAPIRPLNTSATSQPLTSAEAAQRRDFKAFKKAQRSGR